MPPHPSFYLKITINFAECQKYISKNLIKDLKPNGKIDVVAGWNKFN